MTQVWNLGKARFGFGALALVLAVAGIACAPQDQSAEFTAAVGGWQAAYDTKDLDALAAVYTEDCVLMPPNAELGTGRAFARYAFGGMIEAGLTSKSETISATASGGVGYHAGIYTMYAPDGSVVDRGKFIEGFTKVNGEWKIAHDIFNSDLAPGAGTTSLTITHDVKDGDHWLAAWQGEDSRKGDFAQHGVANVRVFQNPEKQNQVGLLVDVADMEAFHAFLTSEEGAKAKAEDGVIDKGMRVYEEVK
jgi:ketosteroid isomerase-like protein